MSTHSKRGERERERKVRHRYISQRTSYTTYTALERGKKQIQTKEEDK
jgi:hypothetical protein